MYLLTKHFIVIFCFPSVSLDQYRWTSLYERDRDCKNRLAYKEFAYKKTQDDCKLEDRFQKKVNFWIAYMQNRR